MLKLQEISKVIQNNDSKTYKIKFTDQSKMAKNFFSNTK